MSKFNFEPIDYDFEAELAAASSGPRKYVTAKTIAVISKDKAYRSVKEGKVRSELYLLLLRRLSHHSLEETLQFLAPRISQQYQDTIPSSEDGLGKLLLQKKRAQKLTKHIMNGGDKDEIASLICGLKLYDIIERKKFLKWTAYVLSDPTDDYVDVNEEGMDLRGLTKKAFRFVKHHLEEICEEGLEYFGDCGIYEEFGYIIIRQVKAVQTRRQVKIVPTEVCFAFQFKDANFYAHGNLQIKSFVEMLTNALGYNDYKSRSLQLKDLQKIKEASKRNIDSLNLKDIAQKISQEEEEAKDTGIFALIPKRQRLMKFQTSLMHNPKDDPNPVREFKLTFHVPVSEKVHDDSSEEVEKEINIVSTTIKFAKGVDPDAHFAELYRRGVVKDLQPFLKMKLRRANQISVKSD